MPDFFETFPDDGYVNMYDIMKALRDAEFNGMVVPDHVPVCEGSDATPQAGEAYSFGYLRALMRAVESL
jgi:mannonate dehydratase